MRRVVELVDCDKCGKTGNEADDCFVYTVSFTDHKGAITEVHKDVCGLCKDNIESGWPGTLPFAKKAKKVHKTKEEIPVEVEANSGPLVNMHGVQGKACPLCAKVLISDRGVMSHMRKVHANAPGFDKAYEKFRAYYYSHAD